jgi:polyferredoxin
MSSSNLSWQPKMSRRRFRLQLGIWLFIAVISLALLIADVVAAQPWGLIEYLRAALLLISVAFIVYLLRIRTRHQSHWDDEEALRR